MHQYTKRLDLGGHKDTCCKCNKEMEQRLSFLAQKIQAWPMAETKDCLVAHTQQAWPMANKDELCYFDFSTICLPIHDLVDYF